MGSRGSNYEDKKSNWEREMENITSIESLDSNEKNEFKEKHKDDIESIQEARKKLSTGKSNPDDTGYTYFIDDFLKDVEPSLQNMGKEFDMEFNFDLTDKENYLRVEQAMMYVYMKTLAKIVG